jgi:NAD(P)H-flavin reductase
MSSAREFSKPQKFKAVCVEKTQLSNTVYYVRYKLLEPDTVKFIAGQTMMIKVAEHTFRAMSIASPPQSVHELVNIQDVAPGGPGSRWLLALPNGAEVEFTAPLGRFMADTDSPRKKILVATGTGIAPFRSMMLDETDGKLGETGVSLYWGLRYREDIYLSDEIRDLLARHGSNEFYLTLSKPGADWQGLTGYVQSHVLEHEKDIINSDFYLCGNKQMILDMQKKLLAMGVPQQQMKFDPFY